jgi:subtilisin-like proprotein convertase family protein
VPAAVGAAADVLDKGDFYRVNGEPVALQRWANAVTIRVTAADPAAVVNGLIAADGPLTGFSILRSFDANTFMLTSPASYGQSPSLALADGDGRLDLVTGTPGVGWAAPVFTSPADQSWMAATDEVIVALKPDQDGASFFAGDRRFAGYRPLWGTPDQFVATLAGGSGAATLEVSEQLAADGRVNWANPNFYQSFERYFIPNDTFFPNQWHLRNTGQGGGLAGADVDAATAWDKLAGGSSAITIAILDDGIDLGHTDLAANIFKNAGEVSGNGVDDDGNGWVDDVNGWDFTSGGGGDNNPGPSTAGDAHGTATAGVAAAAGNNGKGVAGIAYNSKILPVRIFIGGIATSDANIASAIYYAAGRTKSGLGSWSAANVLSCSWGGGSLTQALIDGFTYASNSAKGGQGVPSFIATGNSGGAVSNPATLSSSLPGVIAVGASTNFDVRAGYSNFGAQLDLLAPSDGGSLAIITTDRTGGAGYVSGDYVDGFGGTSSSTPLAAGIGALVLAQNPNLPASAVRGLLRNTTEYVGTIAYSTTTGFNTQYGYGRINAATAVDGVGKPEIQVLTDASVNIPDGSGLIDFGTLITNTTATRTFRIRNQGTLDLNLSNLTVPAPFKISTGLGSATLKVGQSTTFSVSFTPTAAGLVNQTLSLTSNDADEGTFDFTVRGTGQAPSISGTVFNDLDGDGVFDGGEPGLSGRTVFIDNNNNQAIENKAFTNITAVSIPDNNAAGVSSTLAVTGIGAVSAVRVNVNITHTSVGQLALSLISPTGKSIALATNRGGTGDNFSGTTFDDAAATPISSGSAPFTGTFRPEQSLSGLAGLAADGTWTLKVVDNASGATGSLNNWTLTLFEPTATTNADGLYQFSVLGAGTYNVRQVVPVGWTATAPAGGVHVVNLPVGGAVADQNFGTLNATQPLTVTVDQAAGQPDPTNGGTINFTVVFSEPVADFTTGDVTLAGTAAPGSAVVTGSGTTYNVAVSGMLGTGTVIVSVPAGVATAGVEVNQASTSTDNTVVYDATAPAVSGANLAKVTAGGGTVYTFDVTYSDDFALAVGSLGNDDIRVSGPNGYDAPATFVSVDVNTDGTPRTATYQITPPGGSWDAGDNGIYTVSLMPGAVIDAAGNEALAIDVDFFSVNVPAANPPTVAGVQVNDGTAQRSLVTSLKVTFSEAVTFPNGINAAFELSRLGPGSPTGQVATSAVQVGNDVTLTFAAGGAVAIDPGGSLGDGAYQLVIVAGNVQGAGGQLDGDGNGTGGDNFATPASGPGRIHRLFGDGDGDGDVDASDYGAFRQTFGASINLAFDFDGDGDVDATDFGQFRLRFGTSV